MSETASSSAVLEELEDAERRDTDRRCCRGYRFLERRQGYDRRASYPLTGPLRDDPMRLLALLVVVNVMSGLDFMFTWAQLRAGVAEEANPLLAELFAHSPGQAWLFKSFVMLGVSILIWSQRSNRKMLSAAVLIFAAYAMLVLYHIVLSTRLGVI